MESMNEILTIIHVNKNTSVKMKERKKKKLKSGAIQVVISNLHSTPRASDKMQNLFRRIQWHCRQRSIDIRPYSAFKVLMVDKQSWWKVNHPQFSLYPSPRLTISSSFFLSPLSPLFSFSFFFSFSTFPFPCSLSFPSSTFLHLRLLHDHLHNNNFTYHYLSSLQIASNNFSFQQLKCAVNIQKADFVKSKMYLMSD